MACTRACILVLLLAAPAAHAHSQGEAAADRLQRIRDQELDSLQRALDQTAADLGEDHAELLPILWAMRDVYLEHGAYVGAAPLMERALGITESAHGRDAGITLTALSNMARIYRLQGDYARARTLTERLLSSVEAVVGTEHPAYGTALTDLGETLVRIGDLPGAADRLERALRLLARTLGPAAHELTQTELSLAETYLRMGQVRRTEGLLAHGLAIRSEALTFGDSESEARLYMAPFQALLGALYGAVGLFDKGEELLAESLRAMDVGDGGDHPSLEPVLAALAALYEWRGDDDAARTFREWANRLRRENIGFAFIEGSPAYEAPAMIPPASDPDGLFADASVGDWVIYERGGAPREKLEITALTPSVAVIRSYSGNPEEGGWVPGREETVRRDISLEGYHEIPGPKASRCELGDREIACLLLEVTSATGESDSMTFAPDIIPVGGLLSRKYSFADDAERVMQFRRGGEEVIVSRAVVERGVAVAGAGAGAVDVADKNGRTALHHAAAEGRERDVRDLIERGADVNWKDTGGDTPLHVAVAGGHVGVARLLVERGADVNAQRRNGMYGYWGTALHVAVGNRHMELVAFLIDRGADVNLGNKGRFTPLHLAFPTVGRSTEPAELVTYLLERGADPNAADWTGSTPLHAAVAHGTPAHVRVLIAHGANLEARTEGGGNVRPGRTPIFGADRAIAEILLDAGADPNSRDDNGDAPLHVLALWGGGPDSVLFAQIDLLVHHGADLNATNDAGETPLHLASGSKEYGRHRSAGFVEFLLERGADVNARDAGGHTALHWARTRDREEIATILVARGGEQN